MIRNPGGWMELIRLSALGNGMGQIDKVKRL